MLNGINTNAHLTLLSKMQQSVAVLQLLQFSKCLPTTKIYFYIYIYIYIYINIE